MKPPLQESKWFSLTLTLCLTAVSSTKSGLCSVCFAYFCFTGCEWSPLTQIAQCRIHIEYYAKTQTSLHFRFLPVADTVAPLRAHLQKRRGGGGVLVNKSPCRSCNAIAITVNVQRVLSSVIYMRPEFGPTVAICHGWKENVCLSKKYPLSSGEDKRVCFELDHDGHN